MCVFEANGLIMERMTGDQQGGGSTKAEVLEVIWLFLKSQMREHREGVLLP